MKRNILFVFVLMLLCVVGITILQLYYSSVNYDVARTELDKEANEAFAEAIDSAFYARVDKTVEEFGKWIRDDKFIHTSCRWDEKEQVYIFTFTEVFEDGSPEPREIKFDVAAIKDKNLPQDKAKEFVARQMEVSVKQSLEKGILVYYTQGIGKRLGNMFYKTPIDIEIVKAEFKSALSKKGINIPFKIIERKSKEGEASKETGLSTEPYYIGVEDYPDRWATACFNSIDSYLLGQLKWIITGTFILIVITLICFWYTIRTLLTQQKLSEMKDDFISNMTHEIHSPISSVIVTAESLKRFEHDEQSRKNYLDIIIYQARKLASLADEILAGARLDKKGISLTDTIDAQKLINTIVSDYDDKAKVESNFQSGIILKCSENHLGRAVANLIENAIKYNTGDEPGVWVNSEVKDNDLVISVADNGPGIPGEYKEKIFSQFYRIPTGNVHNVKGYGLGLSYVSKVVKAHKGSISVKNNQPQGSIFIIRIPYEV